MECNQRNKSFIFEPVYALRLAIFFTCPSCSTSRCYISASHGVGESCGHGEDSSRAAQRDLYDRYNLADDIALRLHLAPPHPPSGRDNIQIHVDFDSIIRFQAYEIRVMYNIFQVESHITYLLCTQRVNWLLP